MNYTTKNEPKPLSKSLSILLKSLGIENKIKQNEIIVRWPEIVGEKLSKVTTADKVENGILFVRVTNSVWRNELIYMKTEIINRISSRLNTDIIKDIRFT